MEKKYIQDKEGVQVLPITHISAVRDDGGNTLDSILANDEQALLDESNRAKGAEQTLQNNINAETTRATAAEGNLNSTKANKATTLAGYDITDAYTKSETYNKTELNNLITTPNQQYVTVATYGDLPVSGSADTIYRVSNYDGTQVATGVYSEYAWDGTQYIFLCAKSSAGEVFDISEYNSSTAYTDLATALGTNGDNIPANIRKGGMSVKFIQSSDNKYVQYRCIADEFTTDVTKWEICDGGIYIQNPEFIKVVTDKQNKILWAIKKDGTIYYGVGVPQQIIDYVGERITELHIENKVNKEEGKSLIDENVAEREYYILNPEFIDVETDNDGRILWAIEKNGNILFGTGVPQQIIDYVESKTANITVTSDKYATPYHEQEDSFYNKVRTDIDSNTILFLLMTDTHAGDRLDYEQRYKYAKIGNKLAENLGADALIHLGDIVDGTSYNENVSYLVKYMNDGCMCHIPFLYAIAHHERYPWVQGDEYAVSKEKVFGIAGRYNKYIEMHNDGGNICNYFCDIKDNVRIIFLDSIYNKWGFSQSTIDWLHNVLGLSTGKQVVFFSHVPSLNRALYDFGTPMTNDTLLHAEIESFINNGGKVVGYFHGHTHWDNIIKDNDMNYTLCSTTACFPDNGWIPVIEDGITQPWMTGDPDLSNVSGHPMQYRRTYDDYTEVAFDAICIHTDIRVVNLFRFGSGVDRSFNY